MRSRTLILTILSLLAVLPVRSEELAVKVRQFPRFASHSIQGMCITKEGYLIQAYDGGQCRIYDLNQESSVPVAEFPLASVGKDNHANAISLSDTPYEGAEFPLIYVTGGQPTNGLMECHVEAIVKNDGQYRAKRVQRIVLSDEFVWDMKPSSSSKTSDGFQKIWGSPTWLFDGKKRCLYVFSAIYRTTLAYSPFKGENRYVVTKLRLPEVTEGDVTLTRKDVQEQSLYDFDAFITQSGCVEGSEIYYTFGFGRDRASQVSSQLRVYDLEARRITGAVDLAAAIPEELESCDFYKGSLFVMTQKGNLFKVKSPVR